MQARSGRKMGRVQWKEPAVAAVEAVEEDEPKKRKRKFATPHRPYSNFHVGAVVLCDPRAMLPVPSPLTRSRCPGGSWPAPSARC